MRAFRARMRAVGRLVRDGFGLGEGLDAPRMNQDACRMMMSLIIETLVQAEDSVSTDELAAVSKIIAEQRKIDASRGDVGGAGAARTVSPSGTPAADDSSALPGSFSRIVDQIYGTNLADRDEVDPSQV